jgi:superoxide dismutase, Fe-Mn family
VYRTNINNVIAGPNGASLKGLSLEAIQRNVACVPDAIRTPVINAGGGHWNHSMFWTIMAPPGSANSSPVGDVKSKIEADFGSFDEMKTKFNAAAAARFGSGWAWLSLGEDGKLFISSTANQENPLMAGRVDKAGLPILGLDVWEHAYYLKYQNRRPEYISAFWNVVNWDQVTVNYSAALEGKGAVFDVPLE